ncbi:SAM-dependent methyltransferase [Sphingomonas sp. ASV193]|uniref:class I SAM-dependent methyltransferase n=1 Tax=Sphingomonas sp. ASV193 TaxID=3144405 RepID=UPI0032E8BAFB
MTPLETALVERIKAEGPLPLDAYMEACNAYYYATRDPLGAEGDFTTAPEISQMFGELVGAALADAWARAGRPGAAVYAELGPGRGTLASDALRVLRAAGFDGAVHFVETSPVLRAAQAAAVPGAQFHDDIDGLPDAPLLLVANEFLDALPVQQWVGDQPRRVDWIGGRLAFDRDGAIREVAPAREAAARAIAAKLAANGGVAILIDYGHAIPNAVGDTFQAMHAHVHTLPLDRPGEQDLTSHVDFAAIAAAVRDSGVAVSRCVSQGSWLETLGIGPRAMALAARNPDRAEAIAADRRRLCAEEEMGTLFKVMALTAPGWPMVAGVE